MIHLHLDPRSGRPPYQQLVQQIRFAVRNGTLQPGMRLPAAREVVASLAINPNTVFKAYTELEREGLVASRPGQGTFVADTVPNPKPGSAQAPSITELLARGCSSGGYRARGRIVHVHGGTR